MSPRALEDVGGRADDPSLASLTDTFIRKGLDGACVDLTPMWAAQLGLHVLKVIIPALLPLHGNHHYAYLGHTRLKESGAVMPGATIRHGLPVWPFPHPSP